MNPLCKICPQSAICLARADSWALYPHSHYPLKMEGEGWDAMKTSFVCYDLKRIGRKIFYVDAFYVCILTVSKA